MFPHLQLCVPRLPRPPCHYLWSHGQAEGTYLKRPCRVCCSGTGFLECLLCDAVPIPLYCLCLLARAMPLWNYYFSMLHRSPFPTLRGLRTAVVPMLRPSSHWLQWTSQLPRCVGDSPLSRGCGSCIHYLDVSPRLCISSCVELTTGHPRVGPVPFLPPHGCGILLVRDVHTHLGEVLRTQRSAILGRSGARTPRKIRVVPPHTLR